MNDPLEPSQQPPEPSRRRLPMVAAIFAALVLVAGAAILLTAFWQQSHTFGWFAYAPLSESAFSPEIQLLSTQQIIGWLLIAVGACAAAFWVGLAMGGRRLR